MTAGRHRARRLSSAGSRALIAAIAVAATVLGGIIWSSVPATADGSPCGPTVNAIACENQKDGTSPAIWDIQGAGDPSIQGFSTDISVNAGNQVNFKIKTDAASYTIDIYRLGYYKGAGARFIQSIPNVGRQNQPACANDPSTLNYDCGTWAVSATWAVPSTAVSGVYIAKLTAPGGAASHISFIVRNDASTSAIVFQTSDQTWQAYNTYGDSDFYTGTASLTGTQARAFKISYNRPFATRDANRGRDFLFSNEYPTIRYLEQNGYDVSYISGVDTDRYGATLLRNHQVFLSVGHDEYWSQQQRTNVENARDRGMNLMFLSGNEVYWHTRFEPSIDGSNTDYRTLVCYKDTWDSKPIDPSGESTATWRDPRFAQAPGGTNPENSLTGTMYMSNETDLAITVSQAEGKLRLWRGTGLGSMTAAATTLAPHTIGYESDEDIDNGYRPAGLVRLSTTTGPTPQYLTDFGNTVVPGTTTHHLTLYRAASGALVFGAGTIQWGWGLDINHDGNNDGTPADPRMRQATMNMLADMGVQPTTRASDLQAAAKSTDATAPTATITSPAANASLANGAAITVTGTAVDAGGGAVAGVEVSMDGGATWHPATGTTSWSYTGIVAGSGTTAIMARATDDSANMQKPGASLAVTVNCPCSVLGAITPAVPDANDGAATEVGMRFSSTQDGYVTGVRFYKSAANTGTHTGRLWSAAGVPLATGTFIDETATGWQTMTFADPVAVTADTTYIVSYTAPNGHYAADGSYFYFKPKGSPPLQAQTTSPDKSTFNGVYSTTPGAFPTSTYRSSNYYVDALFIGGAAMPPSVTAQSPSRNATSVPTSVKPTVTFTKSMNAASIAFTVTNPSGQAAAGSIAYDATTRVATFTPTAPLTTATTYTVSVTGADTSGNVMTAPFTWTFETAYPGQGAGQCPCSVYPDTATPSTITVNDPASVELGMKFTADTDGIVTGVKFYKGPQNIGTHTGSLWSSTGAQIATGTFTGETATGWQTLLFDSPAPITAGTTYIASYRTTVGYYSMTPGGLSAAVDRFPLHAQAGSVYTYGAGAPTQGSTADYGVDVVFTVPNSVVPTVTATSPAAGAADVLPLASVSASFSTSLMSNTATVTVTGPSGAVAGTTALDSVRKTLTYTPSQPFAAGSSYTVKIDGARSLSGIGQAAPVTFGFAVAGGAAACPCSLFPTTATPATIDSGDGGAVTLGTQFIPLQSGYITAIKFYKSPANTGTHSGSIWSAAGDRLASVTFSSETASGWQMAPLSTPLQVTAGTTYVVSYFAPSGRYSFDSQYFAKAYTNGPLNVPAGNGRFVYGSDAFPTGSYGNANYWTDVVFTTTGPSATPPVINSASPIAGASSVPLTIAPSVTFSEPVTPGSVTLTVADPGGAPVAGTLSYDAGTSTATFTPSAPLAPATTYSVAVTATDPDGNQLSGARSWTFLTQSPPAAAGQCPCALWDDTAAPADANHQDPRSVELGVKFTADTAGVITGVKFYKGSQNIGTHTGSLWNAAGTQLASAAFGTESSTGWQTVTFSSPISVTPGATYIASYSATAGYYSVTQGAFASAGLDIAPLHVPAHGATYAYGGGFPGNSSDVNYWITPVFQPGAAPGDATAPSISAISVTPTSTGATVTWTASETSTAEVIYGTAADALNSNASGSAGTTAHSVTLSGLAPATTYYYQVRSADPAGNTGVSPTPPATFTTLAPPDTTPPAISGISVSPTATDATITWTTDESSTSEVVYGASAAALTSTATGGNGTAHSVALAGLAASTTYYFQVRSTDGAGNGAVSPAAASTFTTLTPPDSTPPTITAVAAAVSGANATITWTTNESSSSIVDYGTTAAALTSQATTEGLATAHTVTLSGLSALTRYYFRVTSVDAAGNSATSPAPPAAPGTFAPTIAGMGDATAANFTAGTRTNTTVSDYGDGEVILAPAISADFGGTALPSTFNSSTLVSGGRTSVAGGNATVLGSTLASASSYTSGRSIEARVTLRPGQSMGWVSSAVFGTTAKATFSVNTSNQLIATVNDAGSNNATFVAATGWTATPRTLRIDWMSTMVAFWVDGAQVYTRPYAPSTLFSSQRASFTDPVRTDGGLILDWARMSPYASTGAFLSRVFDATTNVTWDAITWDATVPSGSTATLQVRTGATATPGTGWSAWTTVPSGTAINTTSRYLQYQLTYTSTGSLFVGPTVRSVQIAAHI